MKMKKALLILSAISMMTMMCACQSDKADNNNVGQPTQQEQLGEENKVDFGLQNAPDPDFDSPNTGDGDKLYTIIGDYAYELDPSTLQPIGPPLDPITHEPVDNPVLDGENPSMPNNPQYNQGSEENSGDDVETPQTGGSLTQEPNNQENILPDQREEDVPPPDTSLPNTGMFLEDD